jgi:membrane protein YdbS with pleckstrin-like domain
VPEAYKLSMADKGKREPSEAEMETPKSDQEERMAGKERELSSEVDKSKELPSQDETTPKKSPAEEEKSGELIGEQPVSQAEEILSEPILIPRNPLALIARSTIIIFFVDCALALVLLTLATLPGLSGRLVFGVAALLLVLKSLLLIGLIIRSATTWTQHSYYLTERQLMHRWGIVNIEEKIYELDNIRHVRLHQDFIGRQFDFGHIELLVATAGLTETITLTDLKNPEHFKSIFSNYLG